MLDQVRKSLNGEIVTVDSEGYKFFVADEEGRKKAQKEWDEYWVNLHNDPEYLAGYKTTDIMDVRKPTAQEYTTDPEEHKGLINDVNENFWEKGRWDKKHPGYTFEWEYIHIEFTGGVDPEAQFFILRKGDQVHIIGMNYSMPPTYWLHDKFTI